MYRDSLDIITRFFLFWNITNYWSFSDTPPPKKNPNKTNKKYNIGHIVLFLYISFFSSTPRLQWCMWRKWCLSYFPQYEWCERIWRLVWYWVRWKYMDGKNIITNYLVYLKIFLLCHCYYSVYLDPVMLHFNCISWFLIILFVYVDKQSYGWCISI